MNIKLFFQIEISWNLKRIKLFKSLSLGFWNKQRSEETDQHEESKDLHHVWQPTVLLLSVSGTVVVLQSTDTGLSNNSTNFTGSSRDTVGSRSVSGWVTFTRNNESGEDSGQNEETTDLNWLSSNSVHGSNSEPVTWNGTSANQNQVTSSLVVKGMVNVLGRCESDGGKNRCSVKTETVVGNIQHEPGACSTNQNLHVSPLTEVDEEVSSRSLWRTSNLVLGKCLLRLLQDLDLTGFSVTVHTGGELSSVSCSLFNLSGNVKGVSWGFWDGQSEVKSNQTWDTSETNDDSPHLVTSSDTVTGTLSRGVCDNQNIFVAGNTNNGDNTGKKLTPTLVGKHSTHDGTSPFGGGEFGGNNGTQWVVTTDSDTLDNSVESKDSWERDGLGFTKGTLKHGGRDHDDQLSTVNLLSSEKICE
ncbi:hypothetical protein OGAPHI_006182 [Ogataea philodendri]|uniref:Uncharacterized protein n=1 Tax=Ogataea philodendri TaxID=1378263 RepID=A0A9P8T1S9_9ASCO|nr:uncharacterized protein OGAPHI_006182 [Ogataea philodendri]KAH3662001.1 hypothetical protein OGAPHI_006182 [Ogataea philodendri]